MTNLPPGWTTAKVGDVLRDIEAGKSEKTLERRPVGEDVGVVKVSAVTWGEFDAAEAKAVAADRFDPAKSIRRGDLLFSRANTVELAGAVVHVQEDHPLLMLSDKVLRLVIDDAVATRFLMYSLRTTLARRHLEQSATGTSTSMRNITQDALRMTPLLLPPINEQRRIVAKLDAIFERTRAAKARLERLPTLLDTLKRSILAAAFRGDLTADWRTANPNSRTTLRDAITSGVDLPPGAIRGRKQARADIAATDLKLPELPRSWTYCSVRDLYESRLLIDFADGNHGSDYPRASEFGDDGIPFVTATQVTEDGRVLVAAAPRLNHEKANTLRKGWAIGGDVLLTHNATVGRVAQVPPGTKPFLLGTSATFYRPHPHWLDSGFLSGFFASPAWQNQLERVMRQTTRNQVSIQRQEPLLIALAPIAEQREISRLLSIWFGALETLQAHLGLATRISELERTALAKAFRGELVDPDPSDEPASELLARIRAAVTDDEPSSQRERAPRAASARTKTRSTATANARTRSRTKAAEPR